MKDVKKKPLMVAVHIQNKRKLILLPAFMLEIIKSKVNVDGKKRHVRISIEVFKDRRTLLKSYDLGKKKKSHLPKESSKRLSSSVNKTSMKCKYTKNKPNPKKGLSASNVRSINSQTERAPMFAINGETAKFLQAIEKKPVGSVVVTLDGAQGSGKTTSLFQFINDFAEAGNTCLFASLEEHPASNLFAEKRDKYLSNKAQEMIDVADEFEDLQQLYDTVDHYDCIFIDSWQKLEKMIGRLRLDEDLRKRFHSKVFFIIFQQTTTGRTKGGAEIVFDGDIIIKLQKEAKFEDNYAYFDKNRYTKIPLEKIRYNVLNGRVYNPNKEEEKNTTQANSLNAENSLLSSLIIIFLKTTCL